MKCERRSHKNRAQKVWIPRGSVLIPPHKIIKNKKVYDRKKDKRVEKFSKDY